MHIVIMFILYNEHVMIMMTKKNFEFETIFFF